MASNYKDERHLYLLLIYSISSISHKVRIIFFMYKIFGMKKSKNMEYYCVSKFFIRYFEVAFIIFFSQMYVLLAHSNVLIISIFFFFKIKSISSISVLV